MNGTSNANGTTTNNTNNVSPANSTIVVPNEPFKIGCFKTMDDCFGCEICDIGFTKKKDGRNCYNCTNLDPGCAECSGFSEDSTLKCDTCKDGYGKDSAGKCFKCSDMHAIICAKDAQGNETIKLCAEGYLLN